MIERPVPTDTLTAQERSFVHLLLRGLNPVMAATALQMTNEDGLNLATQERIQTHLDYMRPMFDPKMFQASADIMFTKNDATLLYMEAHKKSKDATEEIKAIDSLVKLHDLLQPAKVEVTVKRMDQLRGLNDKELQELAGLDIDLDPESYRVSYDPEPTTEDEDPMTDDLDPETEDATEPTYDE
jgi:hypothetical protein